MPPTLLLNSLEGFRRKVKVLSVAYGTGVVLAAAVLMLLAAIFLDYLLNLPPIPRSVVILLALIGIGYVLIRWLFKPLLAKLTISEVAGRLEHVFPQFDDRLRSTVDFLNHDIPGSEVMKGRVVTEATQLAGQVNLDRAIAVRPIWYSSAAGVAAILFAMALSLALPVYRDAALSRLLNPFSGAAWPKSVRINLLSPVPDRVPVGQKIDLRMALGKGDKSSRKALVFYQYGDGRIEKQLMTRGADGQYGASLDAKAAAAVASEGLLKVWMTAGDDRLDLKAITVVPRLAIEQVEAVITPPKYVRRDDREAQPLSIDLSSGPALTVAGADVALRVRFNKPLASIKDIALESAADARLMPAVQWELETPSTAVGRWSARESIRFHLRATDADQFQNTAMEEYELIVQPDQKPLVQIENPRRSEERTPVAVVPLQAVAEDDYGIDSLRLMVRREADQKQWEIKLIEKAAPTELVAWTQVKGTDQRRRFRMNYQWDLAALPEADLKPGDVLEYHLLVQDNYELDGVYHEPIPSGKLRINIISQEDLTRHLTEELRTAAGQINEVRNSQNRTKEETAGLAQETEKKPEFNPADRTAAQRLVNQQTTAASQAKQIASRLNSIQQRMAENKSPAQELHDIAKDVENQLNQTAESPMKAAANQINAAKDKAGNPGTSADEQRGAAGERNALLGEASANQIQASEQLQRALDRMGNVGDLQQTIDQFRKLLEDQQKISEQTAKIGRENLGKTPEQMKPQDRQNLEKAAQEQNDLAARTEKSIAEMQKASEQMSKSDPATSEAMKKAADAGQQQQVSPNMSKAAQQAQQNQQAGAQAAQKRAELGLQMILNELREAERRKLEGLSKQLEELQKQIEILIRRQAGHNLDNLTLQGPEKIARLELELLDALLAKSERAKDDPVRPALPQLSGGQEQTESNTRDIATSAEKLPNGSEPATHLTRAAGKMERAIGGLRNQNLIEAYDPPQVEALAALEEAKKRVDEQKNKVDEKLENQQKENVRQAYIKIKEDQEKLNQETAGIDQSPRLPDGNFKREEAIRLGRLPGEQGKLSDRTRELEEALAAAGSVVYVWANKDIVKSMDEVKADLGKPATGKPTQAEQIRVVEQLDAMIQNLAVQPLERRFEQRNNGGGAGGGQAPPALPPEAELRLLKALQEAVNKSTKVIDAQPQKDEPKLLALGGRQGELRNLLDGLLKSSSQGKLQLPPEPDNKNQLPEEAGKEQVENQELDQELLAGEPTTEEIEKDVNLVGDRMARSRQRLALNNDPGKTTQIIQELILKDMDLLIEMARGQQCQPGPGQAKGAQQPQQQAAPRPGQGVEPAKAQAMGVKPAPNAGNNPAQVSAVSPGGDNTADLSQEIKESMKEWGAPTERQRKAVIEGAGETVIVKYRRFVSDYYRSLATQSREQ